MSQSITPEQRDLLAEIGHFHLVLESHKAGARVCRERIKQLRDRLVEIEQADKARET